MENLQRVFEPHELRELLANAFDAGCRWTTYDEAMVWESNEPVPQDKEEFLKGNDL